MNDSIGSTAALVTAMAAAFDRAGFASVDVTSIEDLKEFAKDNGDSKEAIDAIKEPKKELVFEAKGVILK